MSKPKKKIGLIAKEINFTNFSIVYRVELEQKFKHLENTASGVVFCANNIKDKDLILNPTLIDKDNNEVIFTPSNVIPHFYQSIFNKSIVHYDEYNVESDNIYNLDEVVGYILID